MISSIIIHIDKSTIYFIETSKQISCIFINFRVIRYNIYKIYFKKMGNS